MPCILIVDDSELARRLLQRILSPEGHEILEAENGETALRIYASARPDVVITDLYMEGMNGIELSRRLLVLDPRARIILSSADIDSTNQTNDTLHDIVALARKPYDPTVILETLNRVLSQSASSPVKIDE